MKPSRLIWSVRKRQSLLTAALAAPLVFAIVVAPPFSAAPHAQGPARMFGPLAPALSGGTNITPTGSGSTVTINSPWSCGSTTNNIITLSNPGPGGQFRTASRENGLRHQEMTITGFSGNSPRTFALTEQTGGSTVSSTTVSLTDNNSDGVMDSATLVGSINAHTNFVYTVETDYVSIPWSQASSLNIDTSTTCAGGVAQVWIPLADTNGDGRGDSVVLDLDGNGVADPTLFSGPPLVAPSVPTMGPVARLTLILLMGLIGTWFLRRRIDSAGTPAAA